MLIFFLFSPKWSKLSVKTATHSKIIGQLQNLLWWADRNLGGRGRLASWHCIFHFTQQRFVWLTKLSHENSCIENWNSYGPWLTVGGTSWGTCDNSGWPQHHKKCQEKPPAIQTWQMVQLVNSYLKQAGTRPYPGSHTSKKRKLNERFCLVWRTTYLLIFLKLRVAVAVAGYDRSSMISVWMWDLFGCWKFCREAHCPAVTNCHTGRGALGLDGNNNQQLVRKTESGGLPLLLLLLLLSGKIHFTLLSLQEEGSEAILEHCGVLNQWPR